MTRASPTIPQIEAEATRILAEREAAVPEQLATARITRQQADLALALPAAWHEDLRRLADLRARMAGAWSAGNLKLWAECRARPATHGLDWPTRRHGVARELERRTPLFAERVATARMTQDQADHRNACLHELLRIYDQGWDWTPSHPDLPASLDPAFHRHQLALDATNATASAMLAHLGE